MSNERCRSALVIDRYTDQELPVQQVLESAKHLKRVLIIGETDIGEVVFASSTGDRRWSREAATSFVRQVLASEPA